MSDVREVVQALGGGKPVHVVSINAFHPLESQT